MPPGIAVETTPLAVEGVLSVTRPPNDVIALDARSGAVLWEFHWPVPDDVLVCGARVNRGVAIHGSTLFMGTLDARTDALDCVVQVANSTHDFRITAAPLVVKNLVITGVALLPTNVHLPRDGTVPDRRGHIDAGEGGVAAARSDPVTARP